MGPSKRTCPACIGGHDRVGGGCFVYEINPIEVEQWLLSLPLAEKSKVNLRSLCISCFSDPRRLSRLLGIPVKVNGDSSGKPNGVLLKALKLHPSRLMFHL